MGVGVREAWFRVLGREHSLWVGRGLGEPAGLGWAGRMAERGLGWLRLLTPSASRSPSHRFIYELEHFNGVAELLEILGR